jgi:hypothetical protein
LRQAKGEEKQKRKGNTQTLAEAAPQSTEHDSGNMVGKHGRCPFFFHYLWLNELLSYPFFYLISRKRVCRTAIDSGIKRHIHIQAIRGAAICKGGHSLRQVGGKVGRVEWRREKDFNFTDSKNWYDIDVARCSVCQMTL